MLCTTEHSSASHWLPDGCSDAGPACGGLKLYHSCTVAGNSYNSRCSSVQTPRFRPLSLCLLVVMRVSLHGWQGKLGDSGNCKVTSELVASDSGTLHMSTRLTSGLVVGIRWCEDGPRQPPRHGMGWIYGVSVICECSPRSRT